MMPDEKRNSGGAVNSTGGIMTTNSGGIMMPGMPAFTPGMILGSAIAAGQAYDAKNNSFDRSPTAVLHSNYGVGMSTGSWSIPKTPTGPAGAQQGVIVTRGMPILPAGGTTTPSASTTTSTRPPVPEVRVSGAQKKLAYETAMAPMTNATPALDEHGNPVRNVFPTPEDNRMQWAEVESELKSKPLSQVLLPRLESTYTPDISLEPYIERFIQAEETVRSFCIVHFVMFFFFLTVLHCDAV